MPRLFIQEGDDGMDERRGFFMQNKRCGECQNSTWTKINSTWTVERESWNDMLSQLSMMIAMRC
eukprot:scaffold17673_cov59-Cyclotella_meneghiniana.AAC.2